MNKQLYGATSSGVPVYQYTLTSPQQVEVKVITYGGIITAINVPDRQGVVKNIVLGFDNFHDYETKNPYFGCITGRYANRIAKGKFILDGIAYELATNEGINHLHGGVSGLDKRVWEVTREIEEPDQVGIELHYLSPHGEENYPGALDIYITYTLNANSELGIHYRATTDRATVVNLTNHSYWNLAGEGSGSIENHVLYLNADRYTFVDAYAIPTGDLPPVEGTPLNFLQPRRIGDDLRSDHPQIAAVKGFDHNWVIRRSSPEDTTLIQAADLSEPESGRRIEVWTTEPGIQFYSGNFLDGSRYGPSKKAYRQGDALALETQHFPDSPNHPSFPSTVLRPGQQYDTTTIYKLMPGG